MQARAQKNTEGDSNETKRTFKISRQKKHSLSLRDFLFCYVLTDVSVPCAYGCAAREFCNTATNSLKYMKNL